MHILIIIREHHELANFGELRKIKEYPKTGVRSGRIPAPHPCFRAFTPRWFSRLRRRSLPKERRDCVRDTTHLPDLLSKSRMAVGVTVGAGETQ